MSDTPCGCDNGSNELVSKPAKVCRRCGSDPHILFDSVHLECRECFLKSCAKKIRSTIGKTQLLKNNDCVLLAYSGGPSSLALLELLKDSIEKNTSRREQKLQPSILHINTRTDLTEEIRAQRLYSLLHGTSLRFPDWPLHWSTIDSQLSEPILFERGESQNHVAKKLAKLNGAIDDTASSVAESLAKQCSLDPEKDHFERGLCLQKKLLELTHHLILPTKSTSFVVFTGDNATTISNNVMKSVIFGQGDKMNTLAEVNFKHTHLEASIMRPLRDFSVRELAFYLRLKGIEHPVQFEGTLPYSRIADKTESYLAALDVIHSSTYSTLTGVATRMRPKHKNDN